MSQSLAVAMRPRFFKEFVGQKEAFAPLLSRIAEGSTPQSILIVGPPGSGKTSLARVLGSLILLGVEGADLRDLQKTGEYFEINGADKNGVDESRSMIQLVQGSPMPGRDARVVMVDEAHKLTGQAQEAWLKDAEEPPSTSFVIWGTSEPGKIKAALRRRFFVVTMAEPSLSALSMLLNSAVRELNILLIPDFGPFLEACAEQGIYAPGLVLQAAEQWFAGKDPVSALTAAASASTLDVVAIGVAVAQGNWVRAAELLKDATKDDAVQVRIATMGVLRKRIMAAGGDSLKASRAVDVISKAAMDDISLLPATMAALCGASSIMRG